MILANLMITQYGLKTLLGYQRHNGKMVPMSEDKQCRKSVYQRIQEVVVTCDFQQCGI